MHGKQQKIMKISGRSRFNIFTAFVRAYIIHYTLYTPLLYCIELRSRKMLSPLKFCIFQFLARFSVAARRRFFISRIFPFQHFNYIFLYFILMLNETNYLHFFCGLCSSLLMVMKPLNNVIVVVHQII